VNSADALLQFQVIYVLLLKFLYQRLCTTVQRFNAFDVRRCFYGAVTFFMVQ
jgi:hypothetical protein